MKKITLFLTAIFMLFFVQNTFAQGNSSICYWEYANPSGIANYVLFSWETMPNGTVEISIYPHPDNAGYGCFRSNALATGGFSLSSGLNFGNYFTKSLSTDKKKVILTPTQEIPDGTVINFNGTCEYKTTDDLPTGNGNDLWPTITFPAYTYGTNCNYLPNVTATPAAINFIPSVATRTFTLTGTNLTGDLTLTASSNLTLSRLLITPEADGTVNETITVVMGEYSGTGNYITIAGGGLMFPKNIDIITTGFSEYCNAIIGSGGGRAYLTITTSTDRTQIFFKLTPYDQSENARAEWTNLQGVRSVYITGANAQTSTLALSENNTLVTATFDYAIPDGTTVIWGGPVWGTWGDESNNNGNNFDDNQKTYISGTGCTIRDNNLQLDAPTNIAISQYGWLTFDEVDNATTYNVKVYFGTILIGTYSASGSGYTITSPPFSGTFEVIITAIDNTGTYADSEPSEPADWVVNIPDETNLPPSIYCRVNIAANVGSAIFSVETKSNGDIHISLEGDSFRGQGVRINGFTIAGFNGAIILDKISSNTANPQIFRPKAGLTIPKGTPINYNGTIEWETNAGWGTQQFFTNYIYGTSCEDIVVTPLDAPQNVFVSGFGFISFSEVANADSYVAYVCLGDVIIYSQTLTSNSDQLMFDLPGTFNVKVKAFPAIENLTYYSESEFSESFVLVKTYNRPPVIPVSTYCGHEYSDNGTEERAVLWTWETNVNGQLVVTIAPKNPDTQTGADFRAGGMKTSSFKINGITATNLLEKIEPYGYCPQQTFQGANGFTLVPGLLITYNGEIEYRVSPGFGNLFPNVSFNDFYIFGSNCNGPVIVLSPPVNLQINGNVLTFNTVANALSYKVYIYDSDGNLVTTIDDFVSGSVIDYDVAGHYTIKVQAIGDEINYISSDLSTAINWNISSTLATPTDLNINSQNELTFNGDENATSFTVYIYDEDENVVATIPNFVSGNVINYGIPGIYTIRVRAIGDGIDYLSSGLSEAINWTVTATLATPTSLNINSQHELTFNGDVNATSFTVYIYDSEGNLVDSIENFVSGSVINYNVVGHYTVKVRAIGDGIIYFSSNLSAAVNFDVTVTLATPTNLNIDAHHKLTFDAVQDAVSYTVFIYSHFSDIPEDLPELVLTLPTFTIGSVIEMGDLPFGEYFVKVQAIGDGDLILNSALSAPYLWNYQLIQLDTPENLIITGNTLTFNVVENASSYKVYIYFAYGDATGELAKTIENFVIGSVIDMGELPSGAHTVKVQAIGDNVIYSDSELSESATYNYVQVGLNNPTENAITIFPNPVVNTLHINGITTATDAKIVDVLGKIQSVSVNNGTINVSNFANGIYLLIIDNQTIKFVKK